MYRTEGHDCTSIWEQEASVSATRVVRQTGGGGAQLTFGCGKVRKTLAAYFASLL